MRAGQRKIGQVMIINDGTPSRIGRMTYHTIRRIISRHVIRIGGIGKVLLMATVTVRGCIGKSIGMAFKTLILNGQMCACQDK